MNELRSLGSPREDAYWVNFITSLTGKQVGRLPYERMDKEVLNDTPTASLLQLACERYHDNNWFQMIHNIPQPAFEDIISKRLSKTSFVEIRKNHSFVSLEQGSYMQTDNIFLCLHY